MRLGREVQCAFLWWGTPLNPCKAQLRQAMSSALPSDEALSLWVTPAADPAVRLSGGIGRGTESKLREAVGEILPARMQQTSVCVAGSDPVETRCRQTSLAAACARAGVASTSQSSRRH